MLLSQIPPKRDPDPHRWSMISFAMPNPISLPVKVRAVRAAELGASPTEIGKAIGCDRRTINRWRRDPDLCRRVAEGEYLEDLSRHDAERPLHNAAIKAAQDAAEEVALPSVVVPLRPEEAALEQAWSPIDDAFLSAEFIQAVGLQLPLEHLAGIAGLPAEVVESWLGWSHADGEEEEVWGVHCRRALSRGVRDMHIRIMDGGQDGRLALQLLTARYPDKYNPRRSESSAQVSPLADFTDAQLNMILYAK
jgi:hypothetical protein